MVKGDLYSYYDCSTSLGRPDVCVGADKTVGLKSSHLEMFVIYNASVGYVRYVLCCISM